MPSLIKRSLVVPWLLVLLAGCAGGTDSPTESKVKPSSGNTPGGYGDILVAGRPVTGSKPSGNKKIPYQRTYTEGALYAPVTGYRSLAFGAAGLESIYEDTLTHRKGDVETTIDPEVQKAAFEALGERRGAAVALNARTGALLAVVSTPSYDPAAFSGNFPKDQDAWRKAGDDKNRPMLNRALLEATAPGETFDIVIAAAALDHGLYDTVDEPTRGGSGECANATIREALARSCNENIAKLGTELGEEKLRDTAGAFGFGDDELLVPNRVTESRYGSYGNGDITVTPLQLARVTAALANRGLLKGPHLVAEDEEGLVTQSVPAATAGLLLPAVRGKKEWAPTDAGDGTPSSWSLTYARTEKGDTVALAVRVATSDAATAAHVTAAMAEALS
ncbi:penicillin-binding transpeptidase domain-containing protein [Streptomyces sp. ITFR-16]|uniref:penicillin-binding transpeptidase domain-containing protein n=1 Tax=Streptomyces sp. ITFR-16 TaxID=3075198 RepID=UPI00288AB798|nr:penicillin-binding transpeptidase domain-containing protein [Streptomyces sp. ITFR-16]WNI23500.1 penicillin-binding transpeptidase domain-containing protein [Streptomyces sp. ITFR-16]